MRRLIRDISSVLIISGVLLLLDAGVTLLWQEPVTAVIGLIKRGEIDKRFLSRRTWWHARAMLRFLRKHPERLKAL